MRVRSGRITLSATDVANHLSCAHLTKLDLRLARGEIAEPAWENPHLVVLQQRGLEHEKAYIESLRSRGLSVLDLSDEQETISQELTRTGMEAGAQVIYQGVLASGAWRGRTDVLLRVDHLDRTSRFGAWSYEVVDCKLASETKAESVLQLCLYSELLTELQEIAPELFHVIRPDVDFEPESYRFSLFAAYYRFVKNSLKDAVQAGGDGVYPEPVDHCDVCRWWKTCDRRRRADDHLSFVAGASKLQRKELNLHGVSTLEALATLPLPIPFSPTRGAKEGYTRIREQARIQSEARTEGTLKSELLQCEPGSGYYRLPSPSDGDIFLDFEGDPFVADGGREYLFGIAVAEDNGTLRYLSRWALDRDQERAAFEWLVDFTFERMTRYPDLHVYHFGAYEPGAVKRLMLRYATKQEEIDRLLRGEIFVDLHAIAKQSVRASVEQYSLKDLEKFCDFKRSVQLSDASQARHFVEHQLEMNEAKGLTADVCAIVEGYNQDDCLATEALRRWLEGLRASVVAGGQAFARPEPKDTTASAQVTAQQARIAALFESLTLDVPAEPSERSAEQSARWLLAHALDWHGREEKVKWWEFYRMKDLSEEDLFDEKTAVAGLVFRQRLPNRSPRERAPIDQYHYPLQECSIKAGDDLHTLDEKKFGKVLAVDPVARTLDVKKPIKLDALHPPAVFAHSRYGADEQRDSILRIGDWVVANGINDAGDYRAARDLLFRNPPRLSNNQSLFPTAGEDFVRTACRVVGSLDYSVLPIQGPPGAGKTFTGARMICELVRQGKRVGVTAVGHKVIHHLLEEVVGAAKKTALQSIACGHKNEGDGVDDDGVRAIGTNEEALQLLQSGEVNVLGGTSFMWAREEFRESIDVLFVDEAGQMSLANVLACAPAGNSLVLLGDPQQLEQPQKGSHPEGSDISALAHLLNRRKTIEPDRGLFLGTTWRLHPTICEFTSELFYEGRLVSRGGLEEQRIRTADDFSGAGLWFVPVTHDGNQSHSTEEIDCVAAIVEYLTRPGTTWIDGDGISHPLSLDDVLIVAPYNDQVNGLKERIVGGKVGTVDKFQGQQAAVVIYSMTTSTPEDAPRGMEFLYNANRFNVATSRARCACIVVGNARLFSPDCRTPRQMELANVLCRYVELSTDVPFGNRVATAGRSYVLPG